MRVVSHAEADAELKEAAVWYESQRPGLALEFLDEYERTIQTIAADPFRWREIRGAARKSNFHRFPYAVIYFVLEDEIYIMAVMHLHRRPGYWARRKRED